MFRALRSRWLAAILMAVACFGFAQSTRRTPEETASRPLSRPVWMTSRFFDPGQELFEGLKAGGVYEQASYSVVNQLRTEPRLQSEVLGKVRLSAAQFGFLIAGLRFREAGVFIDDLALTVVPGSEATWTMPILRISTPDGRSAIPPRLFDGGRVLAWASTVAEAATQTSTEVLIRWKRSAGLTGRLEIVTESKEAADAIHSKLSALRDTQPSAKVAVFEEHKRWRVIAADVDVSDPKVPATSDEAGDGRAHPIVVRLEARGIESMTFSEEVSSLDQVRILIAKVRKQADERPAPGAAMFVEVDGTLPLAWLKTVVFDLYDVARWLPTEVGIDFEATVFLYLAVKGSLDRCPIRPFNTIGTGRSGRPEVLAGLEVLSAPASYDRARVILGPARALTSTGPGEHEGENFLPSLESRPFESRANAATLADGQTATAAAVGIALQKLRRPELEAKPPRWRRFLESALIREVRDSEVVIVKYGQALKTGARAVIVKGPDYVGTVEVVRSKGEAEYVCKITDWADGAPEEDSGWRAVIIVP